MHELLEFQLALDNEYLLSNSSKKEKFSVVKTKVKEPLSTGFSKFCKPFCRIIAELSILFFSSSELFSGSEKNEFH